MSPVVPGLGEMRPHVRRSVRVMDVAAVPPANEATWDRWLRPAELAACRERHRPVLHLAARLAAKRTMLALLGLSHTDGERDIEVTGGGRSAPGLVLEGRVARRAAWAGVGQVTVSLAHADGHAGALVVAHCGPQGRSRVAPAGGLDILELSRWRLAVHRGGASLVARVTGGYECLADSRKPALDVWRSAVRFALKECVVKAVDGFPSGGRFHDVVVTFDDTGRPILRCTGAVGRHLSAVQLEPYGASVATVAPGVLQAVVVMRQAGKA